MHKYDIALKLALQGAAQGVLRALTGVHIERWINMELPEIRNPRVDLLGATSDDNLVHIELQSGNDAKMALRMAEYCLSVYRRFNSFPSQIVLYVGSEPVHMQAELVSPGQFFRFQYKLVDIRELDGEELLDSDQAGDNVIAILGRWRDSRDAVRPIVEKIAGLPPLEREAALDQLMILSGLRHLEEVVDREIRKMPILEDIRNHKVLGPEFDRGVREGVQQGRQEGRQEGEVTVLRLQIQKRFGAIPGWAAERISRYSTAELEQLSVRLLDSGSLEELLA